MHTTITEAGFNAMVAFACQPGNEDAFKRSKDGSCLQEWEQEAIFRVLLQRLPFEEAIERAKYGQSNKLLVVLLYHVAMSGMSAVHALMERFRQTHSEWSSYAMATFSERYWNMVINDRIEKRDYRRAWDDIRKAKRESEPFEIKHDQVEWMLKDLFHAMRDAKLVADFQGGTHHFRHSTPAAGLGFLVEMYPDRRRNMAGLRTNQPRTIEAGSYTLKYHEQIILELAKYFSSERKKKRARKAAQRAA